MSQLEQLHAKLRAFDPKRTPDLVYAKALIDEAADVVERLRKLEQGAAEQNLVPLQYAVGIVREAMDGDLVPKETYGEASA